MGIIDHIGKVNLIALLQHRLVVVVDLLGNIKKEQGARIICLFPQNFKTTLIISGCFILLNKIHHKQDELDDVFILACFHYFFIYFIQIARLEHKPFRFKAFL